MSAAVSPLAVNPLTARDIWKNYTEARPAPGIEYEAWVEAASQHFGFPPKAIKKVVANELHALQVFTQAARTTEAQRIAHAAGLTLVKTFHTLNRMLDAKKTKREYYKGELVDEWEESDNAAQNFAVRTAISVFGANAPTQHDHKIDLGDDLSRLTEADLKLRFAEIAKEVSLAIGGVIVNTTAESIEEGSRSAPAGDPVSKGSQRSLLLANKPHANKRRAGGKKSRPVRKPPLVQLPGGGDGPGTGGGPV